MAKIIKFKNIAPKIDQNVFLADGVVIAGEVIIGKDSSIWFNSVIRGDVNPITIGSRTNIQDGTVIHTSRFDNGSSFIGDDITIGHRAMIHACTIKDNSFIGMQSTIMDKTIVEEYGFVAAGSLITPGKLVKSRELWAGSPAKFVRKITEEEINFMHSNIQNYINLAKEYK